MNWAFNHDKLAPQRRAKEFNSIYNGLSTSFLPIRASSEPINSSLDNSTQLHSRGLIANLAAQRLNRTFACFSTIGQSLRRCKSLSEISHLRYSTQSSARFELFTIQDQRLAVRHLNNPHSDYRKRVAQGAAMDLSARLVWLIFLNAISLHLR